MDAKKPAMSPLRAAPYISVTTRRVSAVRSWWSVIGRLLLDGLPARGAEEVVAVLGNELAALHPGRDDAHVRRVVAHALLVGQRRDGAAERLALQGVEAPDHVGRRRLRRPGQGHGLQQLPGHVGVLADVG